MIKVSIVVPIYNVEKYLRKCLDSLVNQTLEEIEILCVNDGSTDQSESIIDEYVLQYPTKVIKFNKKNGGLSDARNFAIPKCLGECIAFIDSDDWIELDMFEKMYQFYRDNKCDIVVCGIKEVNERGKIINKSSTFNGNFIDKEMLILNTNAAWNKLYDKKLFDNIKFPIGLWYEDLATIPLVAAISEKIGSINEYYYNYLYRDSSISRTYSSKIIDIISVFEILINSQKLSNKCIENLFSNHLYFTILRCGLVGSPKEQVDILEKLYKFSEDNLLMNKINNFGGLNQKFILTLFKMRCFNILMFIVGIQWKIKNKLIK